MKKEIFKKWWFWVVSLVVIISIGSAVFFGIKYYQVSTKKNAKRTTQKAAKQKNKQKSDKKVTFQTNDSFKIQI